MEKSSDFTLTPADSNKTIETTSGIAITLNPMVDFADFSRLMIKNSSGFDTTVTPDGVEQIDGDSSFSIPSRFSVEIYKGTSGWEIKTLSSTKLSDERFLSIQGLLLEALDANSIVLNTGICKDSTGTTTLALSSQLTADVNAEIGLGDGGMPKTVAKTGTFSSVGTAITGTGTSFTTEFKVGDVLYSTSNSEAQVIISVLNDAQMVIQLAFSIDVAGDAAMKNGLAPFATYYSILAYDPTLNTYKLVFDTQLDAENALSDTDMTDFVTYRYIGSILTNSGSNIVGFVERSIGANKRIFIYKSGIDDISLTGGVVAKYLYDLSIPKGVEVSPILNWFEATGDNGDGHFIKLYSPDNDLVPIYAIGGEQTEGLIDGTSITNIDNEALYTSTGQLYIEKTSQVGGSTTTTGMTIGYKETL